MGVYQKSSELQPEKDCPTNSETHLSENWTLGCNWTRSRRTLRWCSLTRRSASRRAAAKSASSRFEWKRVRASLKKWNFQPRGADRKQKSDHQRVSKEMADESCKGKYIPCYERTRLQPTQPWEPRLPLTPSMKSSPSQNLGFRDIQSDDTMILDQNQSVDQSVFA